MLDHSLDRAWIAAHIPHQGSMCLLDQVLQWDGRRIVCRASSHRDADHPLRSHGRLGAACGIEYAAQAMAVHGALLAPAGSERPGSGFLVSVRGTTLHTARLDDIAADLDIEALCLSNSHGNMLYQFSLHANGKLLLDGRAAVVVNADGLAAQPPTPGDTP